MQSETIRRCSLPQLDDSDEEALNLFNNLNPNPQSPPSPIPAEDSDGQGRPLGRLTKLKKDSKREKKKLKKKLHKKLQQKMRDMEEGVLKIVTPSKKLKKAKRSKQGEGSQSEAAHSHDAGSSEFSSESEDKEGLQNELLNLNPDAAEQDPASTPHKRLKRSGRKIRIEQKEGFRVEELGNDPQFDLQKMEKHYQDEDYSFDDIDRKARSKKRKSKPPVLTNEQIMERFKQQGGVVESEGEGGEREGGYDNGLDMLYSMKDKRKGIKINNRLFCDLQIDLRDEEAVVPTPQNLELELKPKPSRSSSCFSFLSKVESLKKQRGLENTADQQEYDRRMQERAKQSLAKVVTSMISQEYHDDIELEVRVPTIARGKSADIINNTVFLKSFASRCDSQDSPAKPNPTPANNNANKKDGLTRQEFYRQIQEQTRKRRSKYISETQLKESFKKTGLNELEEARKRNQEKRRKQALSQDEGEDEQDEDWQNEGSQDNKMEELLEKEERICGDLEEEQADAEEVEEGEKERPEEGEINPVVRQAQLTGESPLQEVEFKINLPQAAQEQANEQPQKMQIQQEQQINQQNQIIDELASASQHHQPSNQQAEEEAQQALEQEIQEDEQESESQSHAEEKAAMQEERRLNDMVAMAEPDHQQQKQIMELEEEGIMIRKRKQPEHRQTIPTRPTMTSSQEPPEEPRPISPQEKENAISLPNTIEPLPQKMTLQLAGDHEEEFRNFKKLRKWAMVIAEKRKVREQGRKYAAEFLEQEAEEGSDNEDHDDLIKKIDYAAEEKQYEGVDLDADLVELIDNAVDLNEEDEQQAFRKYLEDIRIKDRQEIRKIIRGEFRTRQEDDELDIGEDQRRRQERMEEVMNWMKQREEEDGQGIYLKPPEEEQERLYGSDSEEQYDRPRKQSQQQQEEEDVQRIPEEQEKAMIERFIENTLPSAKRDFRPTKTLDLGPLPESVKLDKGTHKTIGLSRLGSKNSSDSQPGKLKKTSSLVNEILSRTSITKISQKTLTSKFGKR